MNKPTAKTIEIFLPDGDPQGIRVASITSRTVDVSYIPRAKLNEAKTREKLSGVGIYILVGLSEEHSKPEVYIGEAENCLNRLLQHNAHKDFWHYALAITSRIQQFTKTHVKYLEWLCYDEGLKTQRCKIHNTQIPTKPHLSESMEADLQDSFETITVLVSTLGLPFFQPARGNAQPTKKDSKVFHIKGRNGHGQGIMTDEGFVILSGSKLSNDVSPTIKKRNPSFRDKYFRDSKIEQKDDHILLLEDIVCSSPSTAGSVVIGHAVNGWTAWKLENGQTLSDIYRTE